MTFPSFRVLSGESRPPLFSLPRTGRRSFRARVFFSALAFRVGLAVFALAGAPPPLPPAPPAPTLRAHWTDPLTGAPTTDVFTGDCLLIVPGHAGAPVTIVPVPPWTQLRTSPTGAWRPSAALRPPEGSGKLARTRVELSAPDRRPTPLTVWVYTPVPGSLGPGQYGPLTVGREMMGMFRPPERAAAEKVRKHPGAYAPPRLFLPLAPETLELLIAGRLRVGDLVVPSEELDGARPTGWTPVHYPLWRAVETIRAELVARGIRGDALKFLSCFRPPTHNLRIGSGNYGRHIYGDAMDLYVDADGDGAMDDLNRDGRIDRRDGLWLIALIEELMADGRIPVGGVGVYTFDDSPRKVTIHFDLRGHRATWGYHTDARDRRSEFAWRSRRFGAQDLAEEAERNEVRRREGKPPSPPMKREELPLPPPAR